MRCLAVAAALGGSHAIATHGVAAGIDVGVLFGSRVAAPAALPKLAKWNNRLPLRCLASAVGAGLRFLLAITTGHMPAGAANRVRLGAPVTIPFAFRPQATAATSLHILAVGDRIEVPGIGTGSISTEVVDEFIIGKRPSYQPERHPMNQGRISNAIARMRSCALPFPASTRNYRQLRDHIIPRQHVLKVTA